MSSYSLNITPPILWIMSWNSRSKHAKKAKFDVVSNLVIKKFDVNLVILQYDLSIL
jgi:hypothetical protein